MKILRSATLLFFSIVLSSTVFSQTPCADEEAYNKPGFWREQSADDLAVPDPTFRRTEFPDVLAKAQNAVELIKKANPKLTGLEGRPQRSIRHKSYFPNGALPFSAHAAYFEYYCVPDTPGFTPAYRGKIHIGGETGTWFYIFFNSFGWLTNADLSLGKTLLSAKGETIYQAPRDAGTFKNYRLFISDAIGKNSEVIILAAPGIEPFKYLSREDYILARKRQLWLESGKINADVAKKLTENENLLAQLEANPAYTAEQKKQMRAMIEKTNNIYQNDSSSKTSQTFNDWDKQFDELLAKLSPS